MRGLLNNGSAQFTVREAALFLECGKQLLNSYKLLAFEAAEHTRARWQLKPKHHHFDHGVRRAFLTRRNPANHWLFKHEHAVWCVAKLASKAHAATCAKRAMERWLLRWVLKVAPSTKTPPQLKANSKYSQRFRKCFWRR
eukprot:13873386-Alexandrium_andersonii.AAC.1